MYMKYLSSPFVCSVDTLSVVDLKDGVKHCKVVTLAEDTSKASSLEVELALMQWDVCIVAIVLAF